MAAKKKAKAISKVKRKAPAKATSAKSASKFTRKFKSLAEVRAAIDAMDKKMVPLLCERLYYVTQAAQFKPSVIGVVVQWRVEEVVENAKRLAKPFGANAQTIEAIYRVLIDASTLDEQQRWRDLHARTK
jgi:isochorismate pyruvate lyase